jgi:uncharacterized membrane protein
MADVTEDELRLAIMKIDLLLKQRQFGWERPRAVAMVLLAVAALVAAFRVPDLLWPSAPQTISVHFNQPPVVRVQP